MSGWASVPFWSIAQRRDRTGYESAELLSVYREWGVVRRASRDDNFNRAGEDLSDYKLVREGDLVLNKMKTWQGSLGVSPYEGIVSPAYFVCELSERVHGRFLHHLLRSRRYIAHYEAGSKGIRTNQWDLPYDVLRQVPVLLPPIEEQRRIADFLDDRVSRIDRIIAARREQAALVREEFGAALEASLTALPDRIRASRVMRVLPGFAFPSSEYTEDAQDIPLLRGVNVGVGRLRWDQTVRWPATDAGPMSAFRLATGDVVLGMDRPWVGDGLRIAQVDASDGQPLLLQRVAKLIPSDALLPRFMIRAFQSHAFRAQIESVLTGLSVPHLSGEQILEYQMPFGPLAEQRSVVAELESADKRASTATEQLELSIKLLTEYKSSLITAAVTGELDVTTAGSNIPG